MDAAEKKKGIKKMKVKLIAMAAFAACSVAAMPTNEQLEKANKEVQASLKTQIAAWQGGSISDGDLAALMLLNADKFKDEAQHYACLQAAFAAAVRANDAATASKALGRMKSEVPGFSAKHERRVIDKALAKADKKAAAEFKRSLKSHIAESCSSVAEIEMIERMKRIEIPVLDFKPPKTLPEAIGYLRQQSVEHGDPTLPMGKRGINFVLKGNLAGRTMPKIFAKNISLYNALDLICQATETSFSFSEIGDKVVLVVIESTRAEDLASGKNTHDIVAFRPPVPRTNAEIGLVGRMKRIEIPTISFTQTTTVAEAVEYFRSQSIEHDDPTLPKGKRGINFFLKTEDGEDIAKRTLPKIRASKISLYDAFNLVCEATGLNYSFGKKQEIVVEQLK